MEEKTREYTHCLRCGRRLKNPEYRIRGYGKGCWNKIRKSKVKSLFNLKSVV